MTLQTEKAVLEYLLLAGTEFLSDNCVCRHGMVFTEEKPILPAGVRNRYTYTER